jgi:DtxR family transcriptional regulator, Mn-dependent transcriptional regulator
MPAISAAQEDYLEAILGLIQKKGVARVRDIADAMAVHKSTVTAALHGLSRKGLINYTPYEWATLTDDGTAAARRVTDKHTWIRRFLTDVLLVDDPVAERNACRMEHVMDREVIERLALFSQSVKTCARTGKDSFRSFAGQVRKGRRNRPPRATADTPGKGAHR